MLIKILSSILIIVGALIILFASIRYFQLSRKSQNEEAFERNSAIIRLQIVINIFQFLFVATYIGFAIYIILAPQSNFSIVIALLLLGGGMYIFFDVDIQLRMYNKLKEKNNELVESRLVVEKQNEDLYHEIEEGWEELWKRDKLLSTVNAIANNFLTPQIEEFDVVLHNCVEMLSTAIDVDRGYLWRFNVKEDGEYYSLVAGWSSEQFPDNPDYMVDFPKEKAFPEWELCAIQRECIEKDITDTSGDENKVLSIKGIKTYLIVPIFIEDTFWGIFTFDDCRRVRQFSDDEKSLLSSVSLLVGNAFVRNELTLNLVSAREEALASTTAKGNFLANMSHEIRTPINAVTGMATIAQATDDIVRIKDCLTKIDAASRQLLALINDILDMSKIEAQKFELSKIPFSIVETMYNVRSIVGIKASEKKQNLTLEIMGELPPVVIGDDMRLSQIIINLLSNAVKFTPEGGDIQLTIEPFCNPDKNDKYVIIVKDNGIGISSELLPKIFNAFEQEDGSTTRKFGGTGLGLAISKNLAELMDGTLTVESELKMGSTFTLTVYLKRAEEGAVIDRKITKDKHFDFSGLTILVAEDIEINRLIIEELLADTGANIEFADDGQKAVEYISADIKKYDMILMDIQMPILDGYSATEQIRALGIERAKEIPIIAMTANAFAEDIIRAKESGMDAHVAKPIDIDVLTSTMAQYLIKE